MIVCSGAWSLRIKDLELRRDFGKLESHDSGNVDGHSDYSRHQSENLNSCRRQAADIQAAPGPAGRVPSGLPTGRQRLD
jgi:hypothetical protein